MVVERLEGLDDLTLAIGLPQIVVGNRPARIDGQSMAEQRGPAQLLHQGPGKLDKSIRNDDHLGARPEPVEKLPGPRHGIHGGDNVGDVLELEAVGIQNGQAPLHENIVVGNIPGGQPQVGDPRPLSHIDPDFRDKNAFQV
ncbi:hypothetical protein DESC_320046 [Desulfosarcina cetonica]|nr:hypothetical protein DESC_320046 [Desulfosarcina cetonica]